VSDRLTGRLIAVAIAALLGVVVVGLASAPPAEPDRAHALAERLRCPTCDSVSVAESPSETARAMRQTIEEQVADGRSDEDIIGYFVARYGEWVLHDPPVGGRTLLVWVLPPLALIPGVLAILRRRRQLPAADVSDEVRAAVAAELARCADEAEWSDAEWSPGRSPRADAGEL
jgi:cytochrome c-type biogenesis protein CcmH